MTIWDQRDAVIMGKRWTIRNICQETLKKCQELEQEENRNSKRNVISAIHGSAKNNLGIRRLIEVIASKFYSSTPEGQSELCGQVFKIEYSEKKAAFVYVRI